MKHCLRPLLILVSLLMCFSSFARAEGGELGSTPPPLHAEEWLRGTPIRDFQPGQIYVVEFWATWCGPCIAGIPHLNELQEKYADQGLHIIGMAAQEQGNDPAAQLANLARFITEGKGKDIRYAIAWDGSGTMRETWFARSGQRGIPTAMIIDREGQIAYIGHPAEMDNAVAKIVEGSWDRESFMARHWAQARERKAAIEKENALVQELEEATDSKNWDGLLKLSQTGVEKFPDHFRFWLYQFRALVELGRVEDAWNVLDQLSRITLPLDSAGLTEEQVRMYRASGVSHFLGEYSLKGVTNISGALEITERVMRFLTPQNSPVGLFYPQAAELYSQAGNPRRAAALLRIGLRHVPEGYDASHDEEALSRYEHESAALPPLPPGVVCKDGVCELPSPNDCASLLDEQSLRGL